MKRQTIFIIAFLLFFQTNFCMAQTLSQKNIVLGKDTVSYYDNGEGGTTLFFIHGSFIDKDYWKEQLSFFSDKYRVIAVDLAGHGKSTHHRTNWTIKQYGQDIAKIIKKLSLKNIILIGHSIGADIMLETVSKSTDHIVGIVAIDYFKNIGVGLPDTTINQIVTGLKTDFSNTNRQYATQSLLTDKTAKTITTRVISNFETISPKVGIPMNEDFFHYTKRETTLLKNLKLKLYLINVDYYPTSEQNLKKYLGTNYELHSIHGTCHFPMLENPKEFNVALKNVIKEIIAKVSEQY